MLNGGLQAADGEGTAAAAPWFNGQDTRDAQTSAVVTSISGTHGAESDAHSVPAPASVRALPTGTRRADWQRRYQFQLIGIDLVAVLVAIALGGVLRFGVPMDAPDARGDLAFAVLLPAFWIAVVAVNRGYEGRFVGVGPAEFQRVFRSFLHVTVLTAFAAFATKTELARGFVIAVLPIALVLDLSLRYAARKRLHRRRAAGSGMTSVLAVGGPEALARFSEMVKRDRYAGMHVVGACLPDGSRDLAAMTRLAELGVPVLGDEGDVVACARACGADTVAVLSGEISPEKLRWISWQLESTEIDLVVSPGLTEIAGRRLHIQPVAGLPLLYVDEPEFTGFRRVLKAAFDRTVAGAALLVLAPVLLGIALLVKCTSRGPAFFCQTRVGRDGNTFRMIKFRSMCVDAEARRADLAENNEAGDGPMFKIRNDPRITPIGRVLRRFSLDELPQLINVLTGSMSLVGPRPPLPDEVELYGADVRRRLLVKPGLTGLWQISGRSDLSWEESVRLDLRYVENWSLALDVVVLLKTARAVFCASGAY